MLYFLLHCFLSEANLLIFQILFFDSIKCPNCLYFIFAYYIRYSVVRDTLFQHKDTHKLTWRSPDGKTINQIDHLMIETRWRSSLQNVRVYRGADISSDHFMLVSSLRLKLTSCYRKRSYRKRYDVGRLKDPLIMKEYVGKL